MKLFISSRGINTLDINYLDALADKEIEVYTDYETLINNFEVIKKAIIKNNCSRCGGKAFIKADANGNMVESTCPICNGALSYNITLLTASEGEEFIFDDLLMDHSVVKHVDSDKTLDQAIIDECDNMVVICNNQDKEYNIKTSDLGLMLAYKKKGND